jgi:hypothetical protein
MGFPQLRWILCACWIAVTLVAFFIVDASSARSWMYLATAALVPPLVLLRLWPETTSLSVRDVMYEAGGARRP